MKWVRPSRSDVSGQITGIRFWKASKRKWDAYRKDLVQYGHAAGFGDFHQRDRFRLAAAGV